MIYDHPCPKIHFVAQPSANRFTAVYIPSIFCLNSSFIVGIIFYYCLVAYQLPKIILVMEIECKNKCIFFEFFFLPFVILNEMCI